MREGRPDPDELLVHLQEDARVAQRGRLKIFFGASAGVGKTCAMLAAAQAAREQGGDVVAAVVETHGRAETEAMLEGLPLLSPRTGEKRVPVEFDLDAALARRPALLLVDELAHSNRPGSRHPKRWQDVQELRDAGIDVWTTMNVQHLESLNDVVAGIAGIRVRETVPDQVFDAADEVVVVDLPFDELLQRLKEGKVYLPEQAEQAVRNFFRKGNLLALRELALRRTADRVDEQMRHYRRRLGATPVWPAREALLVAIGPGGQGDKLLRSAARLASEIGAPWHAVYVETPRWQRLPPGERQTALQLLKRAEDLGATTANLSAADEASAIAKYAHDHNLSRVLVGRRNRTARLWPRADLAERIGALAPDLDLVLVTLAQSEDKALVGDDEAATGRRVAPYVKSAALCAAVTLATTPLIAVVELSNIVMLFLLAVVVAAVRWGRGPAVLAAFLGVGAFDFFYVQPRFTFAFSDAQYGITFIVMLIVALVIGQLAAGLQFQARVASERENRMRSLYEASRDLSAALVNEQVVEIGTRALQAEFDAQAFVLLAGPDDKLLPVPPGVDAGVAAWAYEHGEAAGQGTHTLPGTALLYVPLKAPMRVRGVVALAPRQPQRAWPPEQRRLLDTFCSLLAIAIERIHYVDVAQSSTLQIESERLRNSLLATISHDLRTPLAALVGLAESLRIAPAAEREEIAQSIRDAALRMNALVVNLLDMARLESGRVQLNRQWQPLEEVVGAALLAMKPALAGHALKTSLPADLPLLHIDAVLVERVLCNLLENAAKYAGAGSPIGLGAAVRGEQVEVWIDDQGPGLPPGREDLIFEKFERGRKESATPGVGLGLAICRAIVEAHGGAIRGENREGGGARFSFTLPRGEPPAIIEADERLTKEA